MGEDTQLTQTVTETTTAVMRAVAAGTANAATAAAAAATAAVQAQAAVAAPTLQQSTAQGGSAQRGVVDLAAADGDIGGTTNNTSGMELTEEDMRNRPALRGPKKPTDFIDRVSGERHLLVVLHGVKNTVHGDMAHVVVSAR